MNNCCSNFVLLALLTLLILVDSFVDIVQASHHHKKHQKKKQKCEVCVPPKRYRQQPLVGVLLENYNFYDYYNSYNPYNFSGTFDHLSNYELPNHQGSCNCTESGIGRNDSTLLKKVFFAPQKSSQLSPSATFLTTCYAENHLYDFCALDENGKLWKMTEDESAGNSYGASAYFYPYCGKRGCHVLMSVERIAGGGPGQLVSVSSKKNVWNSPADGTPLSEKDYLPVAGVSCTGCAGLKSANRGGKRCIGAYRSPPPTPPTPPPPPPCNQTCGAGVEGYQCYCGANKPYTIGSDNPSKDKCLNKGCSLSVTDCWCNTDQPPQCECISTLERPAPKEVTTTTTTKKSKISKRVEFPFGE